MTVAGQLINMLLLRTAPQDLPFSKGLMNRVIFIYLLSGVVVQHGYIDLPLSISRIILNIAVILVFSYTILAMLSFTQRFVQTGIALLGTGVVFNLLAWPLLILLGADNLPGFMSGLVSLMILALISWEVLVAAHIYRHALELKMLNSVLLSFALFFISIVLTELVFPEAA